MEYETPRQLASRLKLGREEFCQRLLTTLILDGPYPRWNSRSTPSKRGASFLQALWELSGLGAWPGNDLLFVDEFELERRTDDEKGGAPDYAVLWRDRVWMIELKTEARSHTPTQIPSYFELARHHHPGCWIALTYLTPPMTYDYEAAEPWGRYAHVEWPDVAPLISAMWPDADAPGQQEVVDGLLDLIARMTIESPSAYLDSLRTAAPAAAPAPLEAALELATATAEDGEQRALEYEAASLEELMELRKEIRDELASSATGSELQQVRPWIWRPESGGAPRTGAGASTGRELRFSRYQRPLY